jgi:hypothetical protein
MVKKHVRKTKRHTKKRKGGVNLSNSIETYRTKEGVIVYQFIYPTNFNPKTYIGIQNQDHDDYNEFPFLVDVVGSTKTGIYNINIQVGGETKYINVFFYINKKLFFSIRKLIFNDDVFASVTNILFYEILNNAISLKDNDNNLLMQQNVYTIYNAIKTDIFNRPKSPSILLSPNMYTPVTSGAEYNIMRDWRNGEKGDMHNKELVFKAVTNYACSIS